MEFFVGKYSVYKFGVLILSSDKSVTMRIEDSDFVDFNGTEDDSPNIKLVE